MGLLRFFLAMLVVLAHIPGHHSSFNFSASAVIAFYFISGYLVTLSYTRFLAETGEGGRAMVKFYVDRLFRLYPIFALCSLAMLLILLFDGRFPGWRSLGLNALVIPLAYHYPPFSVSALLPQLWSLGVEFHFYLLLPLFILLTKRVQAGVVMLMVAGHLTGFFLTKQVIWYPQYLHLDALLELFANPMAASEFFGYRFVLFTGAIFLLGAWTARHRDWRLFGGAYLAYFLVFFVFGQAGAAVANTYVFDILFGILVFVPLAVAMLHVTFSSHVKRLDSWLGTLSWPVFACHWIAIELALKAFPTNTMFRFVMVFAVMLVLSVGLAKLQSWIDRFRYRFRGFSKLAVRKEMTARPAEVTS